MKIYFVFELLMFFILLAFAASRSVGPKVARQEVEAVTEVVAAIPTSDENATLPADSPSRFCQCANLECNCCREFKLPVVPVSSSGCASLTYLKGDNMALTMRFGDRVVQNITISGKKPKPVCVNLPGGFSQFCGRVYGISRVEDDFKACLGLELRALYELEASLRVSCFRFSPSGVTLEAAPPLPSLSQEEEEEEDDDDYGFGGAADDDDDDDDGPLAGLSDDDDDDADEYADEPATSEDNDVADTDYTGFSVLGGFGDFFSDFFDSGSGNKKKKKPVVEAVATASVESSLRPARPSIADAVDINLPLSSAKPMPAKIPSTVAPIVTKKDKITTSKPIKVITIPVAATTKRAPTSTQVKVETPTTVKSPTPLPQIEYPDPMSSSSTSESEYESSSSDKSTETTTEEESFSSELADAIKGVEEEISSVADIVDEPSAEEEESEEDEGEDEEESTGKPTAQIANDEDTDEEVDLLDDIEQLAAEVTGDDEKKPITGVAIDGEPRISRASKLSTKTKKSSPALKHTHRVSRHYLS